ncbi:hypothetical protein BOM_0649 [Borrelia miyamotoi FR64b]|nr:hypothetical protein BOM_0649 [Borrelia miyamotoi FR64b]
MIIIALANEDTCKARQTLSAPFLKDLKITKYS